MKASKKNAAMQPIAVRVGFLVCLMATQTKKANQKFAKMKGQASLARKQAMTALAAAGTATNASNARKLNCWAIG